MPRSIWSGSISFGLVNVPVKLYSAVSQKDLHFNQFEEGTGARIHYKRVSEKSGKEVEYENIVKGYEVSKGKFVMITSDELEALEPRATRTIDIEDFVSLDEIDPIYYEHTYYLAPQGEGAAKAYSLLLKAMEDEGKVPSTACSPCRRCSSETRSSTVSPSTTCRAAERRSPTRS
jgi:DNA end-binding protein Ku